MPSPQAPPSPLPGIVGARLDHVACGVWNVGEAATFVAGELGALPFEGGAGAGFEGGQWRFRGGGVLELIEPAGPKDGFLYRFLERGGPGIHHVTFKVPSLREAADRALAFGYEVVGYSEASPGWKECFLHPKQAQGIVVQLAESDPLLDGSWGEGWKFPAVPAVLPPSVELVGLRLAAHTAQAARRQWGDLLGGAVTADGEGLLFRWADSPLRVAVAVDPAVPESPLCLELAAHRTLELPQAAHPALGARFGFVSSARRESKGSRPKELPR